jgi:ADP-ribose pyrophosphatase YjhB (NUDIX family)
VLPTIDEYPARYAFRFCPFDTTPLEREPVHERERLRCPKCGWVYYPTPQVAATIIVEYADGIVLAQRATPPDAGIWHLPIGHAEFGEDPATAAAREAQEETGLVVTDVRFLVYTHSRSYGDPRMWYIVFGFVGRAIGGTLAANEAEVSALQVLPITAVPELKWTSQQRTLAAYRARYGV